jgi:hypothetical protein
MLDAGTSQNLNEHMYATPHRYDVLNPGSAVIMIADCTKSIDMVIPLSIVREIVHDTTSDDKEVMIA